MKEKWKCKRISLFFLRDFIQQDDDDSNHSSHEVHEEGNLWEKSYGNVDDSPHDEGFS